MKKLLIALTLFTLTFQYSAQAYVPHLWMILSRTNKKHGKGFYKIKQDLVFTTENEPLLVEETWYIKDSDNMRLEVRGKRLLKNKLSMTILYRNGRKTMYVSGTEKQTTAIPNDFYLPFFTFRGESTARKLMLKQDIISSNVRTKRPTHWKEGSDYKPEPYTSLGRTNGTITYVVSNPKVEKSDNQPKLWIEQDAFNVRRIRLKSGAEVRADEYSRHSGNFNFPKKKTVSWNERSVLINLNKVSRLVEGKKLKKLMRTLDAEKDNYQFEGITENSIEEFYSRFR